MPRDAAADAGQPLARAAYETLREAILQCDLAPGAEITEVRLAESFGLGRAAVRAALTRLAQDRLVETLPRRGYVVAPITLKGIGDLFGLRMVLEPAAAGLAASRTSQALVDRLEALNAECGSPPDLSSPERQRRANRAFHAAVAQASGNDRLAESLAAVLDELQRVLYLPQLANVWDRIDATQAEHARVIDAIRARDVAGAEQAAREHVEPNMRQVLDELVRSPEIASVSIGTLSRHG